MGNDNGEGLFERLEHEIHMYNKRWGECRAKAKLQRFEISNVNDTDDGEETEDEAGPRPSVLNVKGVSLSFLQSVHH